MRAFLLVFAIAAVAAFWVFAIVDCFRTEDWRARGLPKGVWAVLVIVLPVIGGILWLTIGKGKMRGGGSRTAPLSPDDDPSFLRSVEVEKARQARIRELEEKLAALDDEARRDGTEDTPNGDDKPKA